MSNQNNNQEEVFFDDYFRIEKQSWGTWKSYGKDGKLLITSLTSEACIAATREYLKWQQEGFPENNVYEGVVGGKL
jgi:hypothetical protein